MADLNGDGTADRASPPSPTGTDLTLAFTSDDGPDTTVGPRHLVGERGEDAEDAEDVRAVVADFDQHGPYDLFITATGPFAGDDPVAPDVSELRPGPFSPRGRGEGDRHNRRYPKQADRTDRPAPDSMPGAAPTAFHPPCPAGADRPHGSTPTASRPGRRS